MSNREGSVKKQHMNYTYIVRCSDGSLYTGWTNDLKKRMQDHNEGRGAKYTRGRGPVTLVHVEEFSTKEEAMSREYKIKRLSKREKEMLLHLPNEWMIL